MLRAVWENRDSTRIVLAETAQTRAITEYHGRPVGNGVIVLRDRAFKDYRAVAPGAGKVTADQIEFT